VNAPAIARKALVGGVLMLSVARPVGALGSRVVLHEPIPPDPREDFAMHVALDGDLPGAIQTRSGFVGAPDPHQAPSSSDATYGPAAAHDVFVPDRDTRRPDVSAYDDPFTPSTAPFKRLEAYDAVRSDYRLYVRDERPIPVATGTPVGQEDEAFYADVVIDLLPGERVRIPSVGPGAHVVRGHLGLGADDLGFKVFRDSAENWFVQPVMLPRDTPAAAVRARLVMEIAAPRASLGGPIGDPSWRDLPSLPELPENVARDAAEVRAAIGVSRAMRPRAAIAKLVQYFRGFADSDDPPGGRGSVYLDLALSRRGVCRHRAFAFLVTAQSLGISTRLVMNEAHAWVEVNDGTLWRRIDLGGAGRMTSPAPATDRASYEPLPEPFAWPQGSVRGDDMIADARERAGASSGQGTAQASSSAAAPTSPPVASGAASPSSSPASTPDDRSTSTVSLSVMASDAHRGMPLPVQGLVRADGEPCPHAAVVVSLLAPKSSMPVPLGTLATGDDGTFAGRVVIPGGIPLGDYDVVAEARCGVPGF